MTLQLPAPGNNDLYNYTHSIYNMSMNVKDLSPLEKIRKILADQHGTLFTADLARHGIPRTYLATLEQRGELERVSRGVYRAPAAMEDEMFSFQAIYKAVIFSHETALFLHDLTDRSPLFYSVSVPVGYHSISLNQSGHKIFYVRRRLLDVGVVLMKSPHGNEIRVTNPERTICDVIRSRNQVDIQVVYEALRRYVRGGNRDINLLYNYAEQFRVQKIVREYVEVLL